VPAFAVDAASFAVSAVTLALLRTSRAAAARSATAEPAETDAVTAAAPAGTDATAPPATAAPATAAPAPAMVAAVPGLWQFVRQERLLKVLLVVILVANFGTAGTFEVAVPTLAHARWGAGGYGALLACIGAGTVAGTLAAATAGRLRRPAVVASLGFLLTAAGITAIPCLGGLPGASAAALLLGVGVGFGNTVMITLTQQWVPGELLGRVMSLVMICAIGSFPVTTVVTGVLVHVLGPSPFFIIAGATLAAAILGSLAQPVFRGFGAPAARAVPELAPTQ
jgi:MFS family permease